MRPDHFDLTMPHVRSALCAPTWDQDADFSLPFVLPSERRLAHRPQDGLAAHVTDGESRSLKRAVERLAYYFRREFGYDFAQYDADEPDPKAHAFLWTHDNCDGIETVIGACCFRWREWRNRPASYGLQWVWFHPYARRRRFRARFDAFVVEAPLSSAMEGFLAKVEPPATLDVCADQPGERASG